MVAKALMIQARPKTMTFDWCIAICPQKGKKGGKQRECVRRGGGGGGGKDDPADK